jgi:hypothetical protein
VPSVALRSRTNSSIATGLARNDIGKPVVADDEWLTADLVECLRRIA